MKRKVVFLFALLLVVGSMKATPYTLYFNGNGGTDATTAFTLSDETVANIFTSESQGYVAAVNNVVKVYSGQAISDSESSIKFGSSSDLGSLTFTLATPTEVDSIIINAAQFRGNSCTMTFNDQSVTLDAGNKTPQACKFVLEGTVTQLTISHTNERFYLRSITIYPKGGETNSCGDGLTWDLTEGVLTITHDGEGTGAMADYASGGAPWYENRASITSIVIPSGVTGIGTYAFEGCSNASLTSITIPSSVTSVGANAFNGCSNLATATFEGTSLTAYGADAFAECSGSLTIWVPNGAAVSAYKSGNWASYNIHAPHLFTLTATEDLSSSYTPTQIVNGDFETEPWISYWYNENRYDKDTPDKPYDGTSVTPIPNGVGEGWNTTENQCYGGYGLFEYIGPDSYGSYGGSTSRHNGHGYFLEMNAHNPAVFYQDLTTYGNDVIRWTLDHGARDTPSTQSMKVEIGAPDGEATGVGDAVNANIVSTTLATYTASGCTNPDGKTLGYGVVDGNLANLSLSASAAWASATGVYMVPDGQSVTRFAFISTNSSSQGTGNLLDNITFSTLIGNLSAEHVSNNTVTLKGYWGETDNSKKLIVVIGAETYELDMTSLVGNNFVISIPESTIGEATTIDVYHQDYINAKRTVSIYGYEWNETTKTLTIIDPYGVNYISSHKSECVNFIVNNGVAIDIPADALKNCTTLQTVTLGDAVTSVGANAFDGCSNLTSATFKRTSLNEYGADAFKECNGSLVIYVPSGNAVTTYKSGNWSDYNIQTVPCGDGLTWTLVDGVLTISKTGEGTGAIYDFTSGTAPWYDNRASITSIVIGDGVTGIGTYAFEGCNNASLTTIDIPSSVTSVGANAFNGCTNLATAILRAASLTEYGANAFKGCSALTTIYVPIGSSSAYKTGWSAYQSKVVEGGFCGTNLTWSYNSGVLAISGSGDMSDYSSGNAPWYENRASITSVTIANGVTSLGDYAFEGCSNTTTVTIPRSVESIGSGTFSGCGLTTVTIPANVTSIGDSAFASCSSLAIVKVKRSESPLTTLGTNAFNGCPLTSITVPYGKGSNYKAAENWHAHEAIIVEAPNVIEVTWDRATMNALDELNSAGQSTTSGDEITLTLTRNESGHAQYLPTGIQNPQYPQYDGIPIIGSGGASDSFQFSTTLGNFTKIEIVGEVGGLSRDNWTIEDGKAVWTGNSATSNELVASVFVNHITFTIEPSAPVSLIALTANLADGSYWCTYYNSNGNYQADANTTVYTINSVGGDEATLSVVSDKIIKAGQGVILKSTQSSITLTNTATEPTGNFLTNILAGVDEATAIAGSAYEGKTIYTLAAPDEAIGLYKYSGETLGANKAFLPLEQGSHTAIRGFRFEAGDGTVTIVPVVSDPEAEISADAVYYDLQGKRVDNPTSGMYIVNGKKVLIK